MAYGMIGKYGQQKNMLQHGNFIYGIRDGYYVTVQAIQTGYVSTYEICIPLVNLTAENKEQIKAFIKSNKKELKTVSVEFRQNIVATKTNLMPNPNNTKFDDTLNGIINHYKLYNYVSGCAVTGATENIKFTLYKGSVIPVSEEVSLQFEQVSKKMDEENESKGYISGIIGAAVGGLIGVIPWVLLGMLGYVAAISAIAMGWLIKTGYERAGGKKGGSQVAILIIALVFFTYVGIIASQTAVITQMFMQEGYQFADIAVGEWFKVLFVLPFVGGTGASELWEVILQGFFFAAIGGVSFIISARNQKGFAAGGQIKTNLPQPFVHPAA